MLFDLSVEIRRDSEMTKVVDGLSQGVSAVSFVAGDLRHREIGLAEFSSHRIDTDEDVRNFFNTQIRVEFD